MKKTSHSVKRAKKHLKKIREIIAQNPPTIYKMSKDNIIKKLRKTREEIWEEKFAICH